MISYGLQKEFRDYWGNFDAAAIRQLELLDRSGCCFIPRLYRVPSTAEDQVEQGEYKRATVQITPGSWLFAIKYNDTAPDFDCQITDTALGRTLLTIPVPASMFRNTVAASENQDPRMPWFLPGLYPVVDPGVFMVEIWRRGAGDGAQRCSLLFCCAEVTSGRY